MKRIFLFIFLLSISTLILGIGYAAINNIALEVDGNTSVKKIDYMRIVDVDYKNDILADLENSRINNYYVTTINSRIVLGNNANSSISYEVILKNDTDSAFKYVDSVHDNSIKFYDNENIVYEVTGIEKDEIILPESEKVVLLTFKYKDALIENNTLNSYINIKFIKVFDIEYENINENNLINKVGEGENLKIEFSNPPFDLDIVGDLDYEYENGVLNISNVTSNIKIIGK